MSSKTWSVEVESPVPAAKLYKVALVDLHNLAAKITPDIVTSSTLLEGDGGVGSIRQYKFTPVMPYGFVKGRIDVADHEKFEFKETLIEGGDLGKKLESMCHNYKIEPSSKGGCVCKVVATYKTLPGVDYSEDVKMEKEGMKGVLKAAEGYILANPGACA